MTYSITLNFSSSYITDLDSDTLIGYVLAHMQDTDRQSIVDAFGHGDIPFAVSCGLPQGTLPRFLDFNESTIDLHKIPLGQAIANEQTRKTSKKLRLIPILSQEYLDTDTNETKLRNANNFWSTRARKQSTHDLLPPFIMSWWSTLHLTTHASITRHDQEATPYGIVSNFPSHNFLIYIRPYDTKLTDIFVDAMIDILSKIWRWKAKSRWYGHLKSVEKKETDEHERFVFNLMKELNTEGIYPIINHYFPSEEDKKHIDREKSKTNLITKNAKRWGEYVFKGNITYIAPGSVIVTHNNYKIIWSVLIDYPPQAPHPSYSIAPSFLFT